MKDRAYAKINLSLDVFNRRDDGYHDLRSIMIPINFYDELTIEKNDKDVFDCNKSYLRFNESNSIVKMIDIVRKEFDIDDYFKVYLNKCIPTRAGLGGGTSDGASVLRILKRMYRLDIPDEKIIEICLKVGADVPFNYYNTPSVVSGIGDVIEPISIKKEYYVLLVKPKSGVSTKMAYELLDMNKCDHPDIDGLKIALEEGKSIEGLLGNSLQQSAMLINSDIIKIKNELINAGGRNVLMSGSGSTVFCIDEDRQLINSLYQRFKKSVYYVRFCKTMS